ncbi:MAG: response regulator transcription factor [Dehalococcoidales bacterium]|nr:response regulator transcription factor [Dehalococcoidales bacterium]
MDKIRILLVDDHQVVREGLHRMLELESDFEIVGEVGTPKDVIDQVAGLSPEVVLMDIKMPGIDGIELTRQLKSRSPATKVIMLTLYDEYLMQAIEAGAQGYLVKDINREELLKAIRAVHEGRSPLYLSLTQDKLTKLTSHEDQQSKLSDRELTILRLIADGVTTEGITHQTFLSEASVKRSVRFIFEKLGVHNRSEAVAEAYKRGLINRP